MNIQEQLNNLLQPKFALVKNLKAEYLMLDTINHIKGGKVICITDTLLEAQSQIPTFYFPSDPDKQQLFIDTFEQGEDLVEGDELFDVISDLPWAIIDPEGCPYNSGKVIFGVTYTVLLVCPTNQEIIINFLLKLLNDMAKNNNRSLGSYLYHIWEDVLNRIVFSNQDPSIEINLLTLDIKNEFEKRLKNLSNAPTQDDWDYLEEMCMK